MPRRADPSFLVQRMYAKLVRRGNRALPVNTQHAMVIRRLHAGGRSDEFYATLARAYIHILLAGNEITGLGDLRNAFEFLRARTEHTPDLSRRVRRREAAIDNFLVRNIGILTIATRANYDETSYLSLNPDVQRAVSEGSIACGFEHFRDHGQYENRLVRVVSPRLPPRLERWRQSYRLRRLERCIRTR